MKFPWMFSLLFSLVLPIAIAQTNVPQQLSNIKSIDDQELPPSYSEASEEGLPYEDFQQLLDLLETDSYTVVPEARVRALFSELARNPSARNRVAGGRCSFRRSYIQSYLRKRQISSGSLYIKCPTNQGHMRLIDQVTGRRYTFSNFHDVNLVAVPGGYNIMDVQFTSGPMSLSGYLAHVEASQKLKPLKNRASSDRGYCYWSIR